MNLCANAVQAMKSGGRAVGVASTSSSCDEPRTRRDQHAGRRPLRAPRRCATPAAASRRACSSASSIRSSRPRKSASAPGSACRWCTASSPTSAAASTVRQPLGDGSTFTVYLPWHGSVPRRRSGRGEHRRRGDGETILLVDDEEALVRLGEEMLAELGYEPVGFASSTAALEAFRAEPERFDAVLSDEAMPGMTGSELAAEIRRLRADIPIVLMSGYVSAGAVGARTRRRRRRRAGQAAGLARHRAQPRQCAGVGAKRAHVRRPRRPGEALSARAQRRSRCN